MILLFTNVDVCATSLVIIAVCSVVALLRK